MSFRLYQAARFGSVRFAFGFSSAAKRSTLLRAYVRLGLPATQLLVRRCSTRRFQLAHDSVLSLHGTPWSPRSIVALFRRGFHSFKRKRWGV